MVSNDLYDPKRIRALFDEMAATYGIVNLVSSFGFNWWWRSQVIRQVPFPPGGRVADLMSGMGELWPTIASRVGGGSILAVDISPVMSRRARANWQDSKCQLDLRVADVLATPLEPNSVDVVVSSFGLKTFNPDQLARLAEVISAALRPGGVYSLIEVSVPPNCLLRSLYMFYLCRIIPLIGRLLLGNPDNYRMIGIYTEHFGSAHTTLEALQKAGLHAEYRSYFFGCATGVVGCKPASDSQTVQ